MEEGYIRIGDYPFTFKQNFSILGNDVEIELGRRWQISSVQKITLPDHLGFEPSVIHDEYYISTYPVHILSLDIIFFKTDLAKGLIFKVKRTRMFDNFTMNVDPC